jgi:hypothetical protein
MFPGPNPPNPNSVSTRVPDNCAPMLSSGLTQQSPIVVNDVHLTAYSPQNNFHHIPALQRHDPQPPAYGFGVQPRDERLHIPHDTSNADAYSYRPGTDPPPGGERGAPYQQNWESVQDYPSTHPSHDISSRMWPDPSRPSDAGALRNVTEGMSYGFAGQWNHEAQPFCHPNAVYLVNGGHEGMSPVEAPWSPPPVRYAPSPRRSPHPPPNNDQHHQDHRHFSPQSASSTTPPALDPFSHFPGPDSARSIEYNAQGIKVDDAKNSAMLGLGPRIDCSCGTTHISSTSPGCLAHPSAVGSDYTAHNSDRGQPSTSAHVFDAHLDGSSRPVRLSQDLEAHFPTSPDLKELALYILTQPWCNRDEDEPPISQDEPVIRLKFFKRAPKFRFEPFFDAKLRCHVVEANGDRCSHVTTRKDRAVGHARAHFGYKPFACGGKCGKVGW